jgi:acetate---CoA ligase (ADP-forming)
MEQFFYPKSVAVIGVSNTPNNLGKNIVNNLMEFQFSGEIYSVGPKGGVLFGQKIYPEISQVPAPIDLAVILTPAPTVPDILEQCGRKGIRSAIIESGGFREFSQERTRLEEDLTAIARKYQLRFIGPNGIGNINMENGLCLPFMHLNRELRLGHISILAQSGGVGLSYIGFLASENIGINKFVSMGNKLNVDENDLLEYLLRDPGTEVVCLYLEGLTDGRRLMELISASPKPVLIHKSNTGPSSARVAFSHTAALLSDNKVVDAAFQQAGAIRVQDFEEVINYLKIMTLPRLRGNRLAVISRSGGHAVVAADACFKYGFHLPAFPRSFLAEFEKHFRASVITLSNPLDLGDLFDLPVYVQIMEETLQREDIDGALLIHGYRAEREKEDSRKMIQKAEELSLRFQKPVAVCIFAEDLEISYLKKHYTMPIFLSPEKATQALHLSWRFTRRKIQGLLVEPGERPADREAVAALLNRARQAGRPLYLYEGLEVLGHYGFPVIPQACARSLEQVLEQGDQLGYPLALKLAIPYAAHKFDVGGVLLNLKDPDELKQAYYQLQDLALKDPAVHEGFTVVLQKMSSRGREIILGGKQDGNFGPVIVFGIGGLYVEVIGDVVLRVAPINRAEARSMIEEIKGIKLLQGVRGQKASDLEAIVDTLIRLSDLLTDFPQIAEIDINPIMVYEAGSGCQVLDARIVLEK